MSICKRCNKIFVPTRNALGIYCSNKCQQEQRQQRLYDDWRNGVIVSTYTRCLGGLLRKFEGNKCSICGIADWNNKELNMLCDHIDGNALNHFYHNIRLVCYNCDAQLPTFKSRNRKSGRHYRRQRYAEGKSY